MVRASVAICPVYNKNMKLISPTIHESLVQLAVGNDEYAAFNRRIVNTKKNVLGVRIPDLRKLAKRFAKDATKADLIECMKALDKNEYEQVMLAGLMINEAKLADTERLELTTQYSQLADSWAEIDIFAIKRKTFDRELVWHYACKCLESKNDFIVRYGIIEMMANFLTDEYIDKVFAQLCKITHEGYYVQIAAAWLYQAAAVNYYDKTLHEIKTHPLPIWTKKKALTKMLESRQFTLKQKADIRTLRSTL